MHVRAKKIYDRASGIFRGSACCLPLRTAWWQFVLTCAAVIGQGSLVQTFCHMRTPVVMSFVRALDGYSVGVVFGVIAVLVLGMLLPLVVKFRRRYLEE